jgi:acetyl esterase/lipase
VKSLGTLGDAAPRGARSRRLRLRRLRLRRRRRTALVAAGATAALVAGVLFAVTAAPWPADGGRAAAPLATAGEYLPGRSADVYLPRTVATAPVVVLVPGGAWRKAFRKGLTPLARSLAASGLVAVNAGYRASAEGGRFPGMVADVVCAVDYAVDRARRAGIAPGRVVLVGHSAGAHLAALAALAPDRFRGRCPYPPARADALVGLAGAYDVVRVPTLAVALFGVPPAQDPAQWRRGNPLTWAAADTGGRRPDLRVLLVHGTADAVVAAEQTTGFAAALRDAGIPVTVSLPVGLGHGEVHDVDVVQAPMLEWLETEDQPGAAA